MLGSMELKQSQFSEDEICGGLTILKLKL
jgi:hypothetical protein